MFTTLVALFLTTQGATILYLANNPNDTHDKLKTIPITHNITKHTLGSRVCYEDNTAVPTDWICYDE
jgi:hypothetical protein